MRTLDARTILSASDLANHLGCRHRTQLDLLVLRGELERPQWNDPTLEVLQIRGREHEERYVQALEAQGLSVARISELAGAIAETERALRAGRDIVVQGNLAHGQWFGRTDILRRVPGTSRFGDWAYEVYDTKLARNTRPGTILQLCLYSDLLGELQGVMPERFHVVSPGEPFDEQAYRVLDYMAYYRLVRRRLEEAAASLETPENGAYPEPVPACEICRWWPRCDSRWRADDHLSLVANLTRLQRRELVERGIGTLAALGREPAPLGWRPRRGSVDGIERGLHQARVQLEGRTRKAPVHELLPIEERRGLARLPEPSAGDLFLDLEGDPFVGRGGREYLFGVAYMGEGGTHEYLALWGLDEAGERRAFEQMVDFIMETWSRHPGMHVYHYAPYEPGAFKRLMGRYATREESIDKLLRAERFVDLYGVVRHGIRASVERYSIKDLEAFFDYRRDIALRDVAPFKRAVERALELEQLGEITQEARDAVERYNKDDCLAALHLRGWLERLRAEHVFAGAQIPRPGPLEPEEERKPKEWRIQAHSLALELMRDLPLVPSERSDDQNAVWLLAQLLEFHWREEKAVWWEHFRLVELSDEDLLEERNAIAGFEWSERVGGTAKKPIDRYRFPPQETDVRDGDPLKLPGTGKAFGEVVAIDRLDRLVDIKKTGTCANLHPTAAYRHKIISAPEQEKSLIRLAEWVLGHGLDDPDDLGDHRAALDLLRARAPRLRAGETLDTRPGEDSCAAASRVGLALDRSVLPIQGPPGSGKTYTGAHMIAKLVNAGKKVGVTAISHKVIRNLLEKVTEVAAESQKPIACVQKLSDKDDAVGGAVVEVFENEHARGALQSGDAHVVGGTPWLWARPDFANAVDVLFVDEAGQMSLANVLAVAQAAQSVVLLGDPRQLEQPIQGSHPDGAEVSALEHLLQGHLTIHEGRGLFLAETWRIAPPICAFTSEAFYESRLRPRPEVEEHRLEGGMPFAGAGLWFVPVEHEGNPNTAPEEIDAVERIVDALLVPDATWIDRQGDRHALGPEHLLVVAPYNAHVSRLAERLSGRGIKVGTVDRFQGQEAPVVIYSLATSTPDEAPRGMEFLYSPNRLNVATSRAQCTCIVVASPRLFEPDCGSPRQMQLANAFCRYLELAQIWDPVAVDDAVST